MAEHSCPHVKDFSPVLPSAAQAVHREECTQCFDSQSSDLGVDVCLVCFSGGCPSSSTYEHAATHAQRTGHNLAVNIHRTPKPPKERAYTEPPPKKLAIHEEPSEEEKYQWAFAPKCYACSPSGKSLVGLPDATKLDGLVAAIMTATSTAQASQVKSWEEEIVACDHTKNLAQEPPRHLEPAGLASCTKCDLTSNLWLCLSCGALGCGRKQYGGLGGNGHALTHFEETSHPVSVKLGTIEPEGTADIYCYACNDARLDPLLAKHLANFDIVVSDQIKTEKNMTELQVEQNMKFDFAMTGEDGKELLPLFGSGLTGLRNLGNSCYMASVLQTLFALPAFADRYYHKVSLDHVCSDPSNCVECQMRKVGDGLLSGRYSVPREIEAGSPEAEDQEQIRFQEGLRPYAFKQLIGKGHEEFKTMRQQDADEFLKHMFSVLQKQNNSARGRDGSDPTDIFKFDSEQKLKCGQCGGIRINVTEEESISIPVPFEELPNTESQDKPSYKPADISTCIEAMTAPNTIEYKCPKCASNVSATQTTRFSTFPGALAVHSRRFQLVNWVPTKIDVPVLIPGDEISLDKHIAFGRLDGEEDLPEDESSQNEPQFDESALAQLESMGFPINRCKKALMATNNDANAALDWIFGHMEDPGIDDPIETTGGASKSSGGVNSEQISLLSDMGFSPNQARKALRETGGNADAAVEWLFSNPDDPGEDEEETNEAPAEKKVVGRADLPARYRLKAFISHKGPSVHSGHYVAHVRINGKWVLFNDEKVVSADAGAQSADFLAPYAYIYVFERI